MGLLKAAGGAIGGVLADQWREFFYCDALPDNVIVKKGQKRTSARSSNVRGEDNIISNGSIMYILILASVVLVIVIIYTLSTLNYIERERDYATLRVLGFRNHEIRNILLNDSILTVLLGWIVGVFTAAKFLDIYLKVVSLDSVEWVAYLDGRILALATAIVVGVSFSVVFILSSRIRKIDLVASFKSVE
jgi:putative ABC transport system permease protein